MSDGKAAADDKNYERQPPHCLLCNSTHNLDECRNFDEMEVEGRSKFLSKQELRYGYFEKIPQSYTTWNCSIQKATEDRVKEGIVQETDFYKYLGMVINKLGNLKDHILEFIRKCEEPLCKPLCKKSEDTTEHVLECEKAKKFTLSKENIKGEWEEITEIYRENRKNRELVVIKSWIRH